MDPSEDDEDKDVPELNDDGSDLTTTERSFLGRNRRLGLSLRFLGLISLSFIGKDGKPGRRSEGRRGVKKDEGRDRRDKGSEWKKEEERWGLKRTLSWQLPGSFLD